MAEKTPKRTFVVTGWKRGYGDVRIAWTEGDGFTDPTGLIADAVTTRTLLHVTATGPDYQAAAKPAEVALLTAKQVLDRIDRIDDPSGIERDLQALGDIPDGAIS
jgi:hypothetical protein